MREKFQQRILKSVLMACVLAVSPLDVFAQPQDAAPIKISSSLVTTDPTATDIFAPGSKISWKIQTANAPAGSKLEWSVVGFSGQKWAANSQAITGGTTELSWNADKSGWSELVIDIVDGTGKSLAQHRRAFAVSPKVKSSGQYFRYGVCAHTPSRRAGNDYSREVKLIDQLGVDIARADMPWGALEKEPGKWDFTKLDEFRASMKEANVTINSVLAYTAQWASDGNANAKNWEDWSKAAPKIDAYANYATTMVKRYNGPGHVWEIWNEPDISFWRSPTEKYIALFNATSKAIHQADPTAKVLNGGFAMVSRKPNPDFMQKFIAGADQTNWDIWAYHDYMTFAQMISRFSEHQNLYKSAKAKMPVWINEGGFHVLSNGGEREQALTLVKKMSTAPALGIGAYIWYDLRDDGQDPHEPEHHFGLVRWDFQPKPAFAAYQTLVGQLGSAKFEQQLTDVPSGVYAHVFTKNAQADQHVMVLWREGKGRSTPVWIGGVDKVAGVDDLMGNTIAPVAYAGGTVVTLTDEPVYVKFSGGAAAPQIKPIISAPEKVVLTGTSPTDLAIQILNPSRQPGKISVAAESDQPNVLLSNRNQSLTIAPGQTATFKTQAVAASAGELAGKVTVRMSSADSAGTIDAGIPVTAALLIPKKASAGATLSAGEGLAINLTSRESIHNLFQAEPNFAMHWGGEKDLSAKARLAYDASSLYLEVAVEDNIHWQKDEGENLWRADALQLAISMSDSRPDLFEAAFGLLENGKTDSWVYRKINGGKIPLGRIKNEIPFTVARTGTQTLYRIQIPWKVLGADGVPTDGFRLNFIVNDDDGTGRKQWVQITPGIGEEKKASFYKVFVCR